MVVNRLLDRARSRADEARIAGYLEAGALGARAAALRAQLRLLAPGKPDSDR